MFLSQKQLCGRKNGKFHIAQKVTLSSCSDTVNTSYELRVVSYESLVTS